jgi:hypothetical protein
VFWSGGRLKPGVVRGRNLLQRKALAPFRERFLVDEDGEEKKIFVYFFFFAGGEGWASLGSVFSLFEIEGLGRGL